MSDRTVRRVNGVAALSDYSVGRVLKPAIKNLKPARLLDAFLVDVLVEVS
ncbi:MAG: hypothetical protein ACE37N_05165 [Pseudohongiellaceae bacterium]